MKATNPSAKILIQCYRRFQILLWSKRWSSHAIYKLYISHLYQTK